MVEQEYEELFPNEVEAVHVCYDLADLNGYCNEYEKLKRNLEDLVDDYTSKKRRHKSIKRKTVRLLPCSQPFIPPRPPFPVTWVATLVHSCYCLHRSWHSDYHLEDQYYVENHTVMLAHLLMRDISNEGLPTLLILGSSYPNIGLQCVRWCCRRGWWASSMVPGAGKDMASSRSRWMPWR